MSPSPRADLSQRRPAPAAFLQKFDEDILLGNTGKRLGRVRDVLYDGRELVGVVVHPDGWWEHDVVLQVRFLDRSDDLALFATLGDKDIENIAAVLTGHG